MDFTALWDKAPELATVLAIVALFLGALKRRDCTLKEIGNHCHELWSNTTRALQDNARVLGESSEVHRTTKEALQEVTSLLRKMNGGRRD